MNVIMGGNSPVHLHLVVLSQVLAMRGLTPQCSEKKNMGKKHIFDKKRIRVRGRYPRIRHAKEGEKTRKRWIST